MPNRESLRDGPLKRQLEAPLEDKLRHHKELEQIAIARRKSELSENPDVSESFEKFIEEMVKKHPLLEQILGPGFRIANPFKPHIVEAVEKPFQGVRFPTKFRFKGSQAGRGSTAMLISIPKFGSRSIPTPRNVRPFQR